MTKSLLRPIEVDWKLANLFHVVRLNGINLRFYPHLRAAQAGCDVTALFSDRTRMEENHLSRCQESSMNTFHLNHKNTSTSLSKWDPLVAVLHLKDRLLPSCPLSLHPWPSLAFLWASCLAVPPYHRYIYYPFSAHAQQLSDFTSKTSCLSSKRDDINKFAWRSRGMMWCIHGDVVIVAFLRVHEHTNMTSFPNTPLSFRSLTEFWIKNATSSISKVKRLKVKHYKILKRLWSLLIASSSQLSDWLKKHVDDGHVKGLCGWRRTLKAASPWMKWFLQPWAASKSDS